MRSTIPPLRAPPLHRPERVERGSVLIAIITVHLLVLLWLFTRPMTEQVRRDSGGDLVLISVSDGKRAATPPTVPKPPPAIVLPAPAIILPSPLPTPTEQQNWSQAGEAGGCALAARSAEAIAKDPPAMAELAALAPAYRTSADAVMLWNGEWLAGTPGSIASPATPSLRRVVEQVVAEASPECRAEPTNGPQFIAIPEQGRTTTLVIGSGAWRWSDLLAISPACLETPSDACLSPLPPSTTP